MRHECQRRQGSGRGLPLTQESDQPPAVRMGMMRCGVGVDIAPIHSLTQRDLNTKLATDSTLITATLNQSVGRRSQRSP